MRAREKREEARTLIVEGIDPAAKRKAEKIAEGETLEAIAEEWLNLQTKNLKPDTLSMLRARVRTYLNPYIGAQPVGQITAPELLAAFRVIGRALDLSRAQRRRRLLTELIKLSHGHLIDSVGRMQPTSVACTAPRIFDRFLRIAIHSHHLASLLGLTVPLRSRIPRRASCLYFFGNIFLRQWRNVRGLAGAALRPGAHFLAVRPA